MHREVDRSLTGKIGRVTGRIGPPEVGRTHKLLVDPSTMGKASHRPSGESDGTNMSGRTRELMIRASTAEGAVTFHVAAGESFVPRLFAELGVEITSVTVARPTLDDVFMRYTGSTLRDAESSPDRRPSAMQVFAKAAR